MHEEIKQKSEQIIEDWNNAKSIYFKRYPCESKQASLTDIVEMLIHEIDMSKTELR